MELNTQITYCYLRAAAQCRRPLRARERTLLSQTLFARGKGAAQRCRRRSHATEERRPKRRQSARNERTLARTAAPTWSQHEPKECAGSLLRRGRVPNVAFESNMQSGYRPATKASLPALFQVALVCPQRAPTKRVRRQQKGKGKKPKECAGSRRAERKKKGRTGGP